MPLSARYEWTESESELRLSVPLKGTKPSAVDIYATQALLKINFAPYLVVLDLFKEIEDTTCQAKVANGLLSVRMQKLQSGVWGQLCAQGTKAEISARREASIAARRKRDEDLREVQRKTRMETERQNLRAQMALDQDERQTIENLKDEEKERAEAEVYDAIAKAKAEEHMRAAAKAKAEAKKAKKLASKAKVTVKAKLQPAKQKQRHLTPTAMLVSNERGVRLTPAKQPQVLEAQSGGSFDLGDADDDEDIMNDDIDLEESDDERIDCASSRDAEGKDAEGDDQDDGLYEDDSDEEEELAFVPAPRSTTTMKASIKYTPRLFPTPMRESAQAKESDWIAQNRSHLKSHPYFGKRAEQLDVTESDPMWLKGKGDDFYRGGDFRSAINAYGSAIDVDPTLAAPLANRAACYLQIGELQQCIDDCTGVLRLVGGTVAGQAQDKVPSAEDRKMRLKVLVRRAMALCQLGRYEEGRADLDGALALEPRDPSLIADAGRVRVLVQCDALKREGDAAFGAGDREAAHGLYTKALELDPGFVSVLSNRATCYLAMQKWQQCVDDCSRALELLQAAVAKGQGSSLPCAIPASGTQKRRQWVLKTLVRRATANAQMGNFSAAVDDYEIAVQIDATNKALANDLKQLRERVSAGKEDADCELASSSAVSPTSESARGD